MNEQLKDFLKKASEDESIKDELKALEGLSAEENAEQAAAIAQKAGFDLSAEDFAPSSAELDLAGVRVHGVHDGERFQAVAAFAQVVAARLEALLDGDADALHRGARLADELDEAVQRASPGSRR